jgi:hypothetical protein
VHVTRLVGESKKVVLMEVAIGNLFSKFTINELYNIKLKLTPKILVLTQNLKRVVASYNTNATQIFFCL